MDKIFLRRVQSWGLIVFSTIPLGFLIIPFFPVFGTFLGYFGFLIFAGFSAWFGVTFYGKSKRKDPNSGRPLAKVNPDLFETFYSFSLNRSSGGVRVLFLILIGLGLIFLSIFFYNSDPKAVWNIFLFDLTFGFGISFYLKVLV